MEEFVNENKRHRLDRPFTGVIQKDRIWEQWYDPKVFKMQLPKMLQKDYLFKCIGNQPDRIIINNKGKYVYTVKQFEQLVKKYEKAFYAAHLNKGDVVATIGLTTPELYAIKYSATSVGLITCNLDIFDVGEKDQNGVNKLYKKLCSLNPRMIFTLDYLEDKIYNVINNSAFERALKVSMPLAYSTPKYDPERLIISLKMFKDFVQGKKVNGKISLDDFLMTGDNIKMEDVVEYYSEGQPCNIAFTSGTMGENKAVLISHDANNALAFQQEIANFGFKVGSKHLALLPPFLAFWDADVVHVTLCLGAQNILELSISKDDIKKFFRKYKDINIGIWPQSMWAALQELSNEEIKEIAKSLNIAIVGGERCEISAAEAFYYILGVVQYTGYGASEVDTTFSVTHPNCNKVGSCGLPLPFNNVRIVDDSCRDLTYGQPGQLHLTGPAMMNGYYGRDDLTRKVIYQDENGTKWYVSGDYAVMDDDGCLTVLDRYVEPITINSEQVQLLDIAEIIKKNKNVRILKLSQHNGKIILHLEINKYTELSSEDALESIIETIKKDVRPLCWPDIIIVEDLPRTRVGKVDFPALNEEGEKVSKEYTESTKKLLVINKELQKQKKLKK